MGRVATWSVTAWHKALLCVALAAYFTLVLDHNHLAFESLRLYYPCKCACEMASAHIQALLGPPSVADSEKRTLDFINGRFETYQDLEDAEDYDALAEEARIHSVELQSKVRIVPALRVVPCLMHSS